MKNSGILIMPSSDNGESIRNVIVSLFATARENKNSFPDIDKILFLETGELSTIKINDETLKAPEAYKLILKSLELDCLECRWRQLKDITNDIPNILLSAIREAGTENVVIDLTCGKKDITGPLYAAASIANVNKILYVNVHKKDGVFPKLSITDSDIANKVEIVYFSGMRSWERLASLNHLEIISYKERIGKISCKGDTKLLFDLSYNYLKQVLQEYFNLNKENYRNIIRDIGLINETFIQHLKVYLNQAKSETIKDQATNVGSILKEIKNNDQNIVEFCPEYAQFRKCVSCFFEIENYIRVIRNQASHEADVMFSKHEARLAIDMFVMILEGLYESGLINAIYNRLEKEGEECIYQ